jgi:5-(carboxyamino)imidazole ribonucleotide synthase
MTIGCLGGGQLGRMLALAGHPLGLRFVFWDNNPEAPAGHLGRLMVGHYSDPAILQRFSKRVDLVTYEFENVPVDTAHYLAQRHPLFPPAAALEASQERWQEKTLFQRLKIPTPVFAPVETRADLTKALRRIGIPSVLKTRRFGYDGKGQYVLRKRGDSSRAWEALGGVPLLLEYFVPFKRELSVIAARDRRGRHAFYPLVQNHHREGILRLSLAPAPELTPALQQQAETYAARVLDDMNYVGVLAIEFFEYRGRLLANEMAPRVHNSGHWTIEGAATSQFENHLRAVAGMPLGSTAATGCSAMVNLIGESPDAPRVDQILALPGAHLHIYGKRPGPKRKLGHVTLTAADHGELRERLRGLRRILKAT